MFETQSHGKLMRHEDVKGLSETGTTVPYRLYGQAICWSGLGIKQSTVNLLIKQAVVLLCTDKVPEQAPLPESM